MYDKKNYVGKYTPDELGKLKESVLSFLFHILRFIDCLDSNDIMNLLFIILKMFLHPR